MELLGEFILGSQGGVAVTQGSQPGSLPGTTSAFSQALHQCPTQYALEYLVPQFSS